LAASNDGGIQTTDNIGWAVKSPWAGETVTDVSPPVFLTLRQAIGDARLSRCHPQSSCHGVQSRAPVQGLTAIWRAYWDGRQFALDACARL